MLLAWMIYATVIGLVMIGGALALDRLAAVWNLPRRAVWSIALAAALCTPLVPALWPRAAERVQRIRTLPAWMLTTRSAGASSRPLLPPRQTLPVHWGLGDNWDRPIGGAWGFATLVLLLFVARSVWITRRMRAAWTLEELDGHRVLVSEDAGPAVLGALRPEIVVPRWALTLGASEREMMLHHEAEHVAAKDSLVLALAGLTLVLVPWNAALWFIVRRLRLAVEIDCDARVLRRIERPREYGLLLIAVSARRGISLPMAASLVERHVHLERRILAMTTHRPSRPILASIPLAAFAILAAGAVSQTPQPAKPDRIFVPAPRGVCCEMTLDTIAVWLVAHHPNVVRGDTGVGAVVFVVDGHGQYVTSMTRPTNDPDSSSIEDFMDGKPSGGEGRGRIGGGGRGARSGGPGTTEPADAGRGAMPRKTVDRRLVRMNATLAGKVDIGGVSIDGRTIDGLQQIKVPAGRLAPEKLAVYTIFLHD